MSSQKIAELTLDIENYPELNFICLTEVGLKPDTEKMMTISNYSLVSSHCRTDSRGGGVGIWARDGTTVGVVDLGAFCIDFHFEVCAIKYKHRGKATILLCCYRSPAGKDNLFFEKIVDVMEHICGPKTQVILCGDFNFDAFKSKNFNNLCDALSSFGLVPVVGWPTRVTDATCTLIDQIFVSKNIDVNCCSVLDNAISDHRTVFLDLMRSAPGPRGVGCIGRSFSLTAICRFGSGLGDIDWSDLYAVEDLDTAFDLFFNKFIHLFNDVFPERLRFGRPASKRWVTDEVRNSSIYLKDLFVLRTNYPQLREVYKAAVKKHRELISTARRRYYRDKIARSDNPSRMTWSVVSELSGRSASPRGLVIGTGTEMVRDPSLVSELFNSYFIGAPLEIVSRIPSVSRSFIPSGTTRDSIFLRPFSEGELFGLLQRRLKSGRSAGQDGVPVFVLKNVLPMIIAPVTFLVNLSFCTGTFPESLKRGKVVPVYKGKGSPSVLGSYRPISISSSFSKLFEYAFFERLLQFLDAQGVIMGQQHGFRAGLSTLTALSSFYGRVTELIDAGESPVGIFCDLSRAFDCVNHSTLLTTIQSYGIRGLALGWISSFLLNREQFVSVRDSMGSIVRGVSSGLSVVSTGVPQGSVLGPLLFILYVNHLHEVLDGTFFTMYADDLSVLVSHSDDNVLQARCQQIVDSLQDFFSGIGLLFNPEKTKVLRFHNRQKHCSTIRMQVDNVSLASNHGAVKFLGIHLDINLAWTNHCENLISLLSSMRFLFRKLREVLMRHQLINIYYALVESRLRYGVRLWGGSAQLQKVFIAQKGIMRAIVGASARQSCKGIFTECGILTLPGLYALELCLDIYKRKDTFTRVDDIHAFNTRSRRNFYVPFTKLNVVYKSPDYIGLRIFNCLPSSIKCEPGYLSFKSKLRRCLLTKCPYKIDDLF